VAGFSVPEARLLVVNPFDKSLMGAIEKAIRNSDLGLNPSNDGGGIRLSFPQLNEERRRERVKRVKHEAGEGGVAVRNVRRGDRPEGPPAGGPRPSIRFPLSGASDPREIERPAIVPPDPPAMPHWTEPATGEVPRVFSSDEPEDDLQAWTSFTSSQPRWRGESTRGADEY